MPDRPRRGRVLVASAGVLALLLGGAVVVDTVRSRAQDDRLAVARGGVLPLPVAPSTLWTVEAPIGAASVPGALVTVVGEVAVGLDLDTGAELWRTALGADASCGSSSWLPDRHETDDLVCVTGQEPARVLVLDRDGQVLADRELDPSRGLAVPGPGVDLVRVVRTGDAVGDGEVLDVDPSTGETEPVEDGRDVVVRLEDAVSGEVRWEETVPFEPDTWRCSTWEGDEARATRESLWVIGGGRTFTVTGCGVSASYDTSGQRLDDPGTLDDRVMEAVGGGFLRVADTRHGGVEESELFGPDGSVVRVPGEILDPQSTDGGDVDVRLVVEPGAAARAVDGSGGEAWTIEGTVRPDQVLAHAAGVVVVSSNGGTAGLDAATGRELWSRAAEEDRYVLRAMTDGASVIIARARSDGMSSVQVQAIDLRDGSLVWEIDDTSLRGYPMTVQGRLFLWTGNSITRIG